MRGLDRAFLRFGLTNCRCELEVLRVSPNTRVKLRVSKRRQAAALQSRATSFSTRFPFALYAVARVVHTAAMKDLTRIAEGVRAGDKKSVAEFFNALEDRRPDKALEMARALDVLFRDSADKSHVIGVTGPPGAGKSTLLSRCIQHARRAGKRVGIIAVDPSSRITQGAILGDRVRLEYDAGDAGVFVRSMASRGDYGGVSDRAYAGAIALRAAFDLVFVETVGVGQSESDVAGWCDTLALVVQPGSGDSLQHLKAGIMERPHLVIVNKMDHGELARKTLHEVQAALGHWESGEDGNVEVIACSAMNDEGIGEVLSRLDARRERLAKSGGLISARERHALEYIAQSLIRLYGVRGWGKWGGMRELEKRIGGAKPGPFASLIEIERELDSRG